MTPFFAAAVAALLLAACATTPTSEPAGTGSSPARAVYPPPQSLAAPVAPAVQGKRLDHLESLLRAGLKGLEVEVERPEPTMLLVRIPGRLAFTASEARPLPTLLPILDLLADALRQEPGASVTIEGHTDSLGREIYNQTLSIRRADTVVGYLLTRGIAYDHLGAAGKGETQPIADNATETGRARNRRVDILIKGQ
ncbi:MAG: OmpA family protein [Zoogloeaceae bacterium]|nr:OmpA family protein [Zoogloeaceae bacterium]